MNNFFALNQLPVNFTDDPVLVFGVVPGVGSLIKTSFSLVPLHNVLFCYLNRHPNMDVFNGMCSLCGFRLDTFNGKNLVLKLVLNVIQGIKVVHGENMVQGRFRCNSIELAPAKSALLESCSDLFSKPGKGQNRE